MNSDRLLREIEKRLAHLEEKDRAEALDAVREEIGRERRWETPHATVELDAPKVEPRREECRRVTLAPCE